MPAPWLVADRVSASTTPRTASGGCDIVRREFRARARVVAVADFRASHRVEKVGETSVSTRAS